MIRLASVLFVALFAIPVFAQDCPNGNCPVNVIVVQRAAPAAVVVQPVRRIVSWGAQTVSGGSSGSAVRTRYVRASRPATARTRTVVRVYR